jgi:hypothetical protein
MGDPKHRDPIARHGRAGEDLVDVRERVLRN